MIRGNHFLNVFIGLMCSTIVLTAHAQTIESYNRQLPVWGTSWTPSAKSINGYNPSFYTGFAPRVESPDRIHVHIGRGNQVRVTVILDENTIQDYVYDLAKRAEFYAKAERAGWISVAPPGSSFTPHLRAFDQIVKSPAYGIQSFALSSHSPEETYVKSLSVMKALNHARVFSLNINLQSEFLKWRDQTLKSTQIEQLRNPEQAALALNMMLLGRVNYVSQPSAALIDKLINVLQIQNPDEFVMAARDLFVSVTANKYNFKVLSSQNQWVSPIQCASAQNCFLHYTEFTAIYPNGSFNGRIADGRGNMVPDLMLPGLWSFYEVSDGDVDNVHAEPFYGFIPKLEYQNKNYGYGFHNPAVRFYEVAPNIKSLLSIPAAHNTYWAVKRGGVSHGCTRLAAGHTWELRHIMPIESSKMKQVKLFANLAQEFDLFDINGDGQLEVMGVEYLISYDLQDASNGLSREGTALQIGSAHKIQFYQDLYGANGVFRSEGTRFVFENPTLSVHTYADFEQRAVRQRVAGPSAVPLYEQPYEQDKIQFYDPITYTDLDGTSQAPVSKRLVRLFGRVRGCAPTTTRSTCGADAFEREADSISRELGKPL